VGRLGPARLPDEIAARIAGEVGQIVAEPGVQERLAGLGIVPLFQTGAELDAYIARDFQRAEALLSLARVEPE
jgi:tripartite-type tricarboxylate transporter receptor subunit TctC